MKMFKWRLAAARIAQSTPWQRPATLLPIEISISSCAVLVGRCATYQHFADKSYLLEDAPCPSAQIARSRTCSCQRRVGLTASGSLYSLQHIMCMYKIPGVIANQI